MITPPARIKIAFLASTLPTGGAENVTLNLFSNIDRDRFDVRFFYLKGLGTVGERLSDLGFEQTTHLQKFRFDPLVVPRLVAALRSFSPRILFMLNCHRNAMLWGGMGALLARVPVRIIATHHTGTHRGPRNYADIDRLFLWSTTKILALSQRHADYIRDVDGIDPRKIHIIENGIHTGRYEEVDEGAVAEVRRSLGLGPEHSVVIMVARLHPEKAHDALLKAAHDLVRWRSQIRFLIVGDGPLRQSLMATAVELGLKDHILFLGERNDVATLLHAADVLVLPSRPVIETLPLSVMEAMAAGVPAIASSVGSVPDMITDGENGRLIPPADAAALAAAIREILQDHAAADRIRENARRTVTERFTVSRMVAQYEELFERLAQGAAGGSLEQVAACNDSTRG